MVSRILAIWHSKPAQIINKTDYKNRDVNDTQYVGFFRMKESDIDAGKAYLRFKYDEFQDPRGGECIVDPDLDYKKEHKANATADDDWDMELSAKFWQIARWDLKEDWSVRPNSWTEPLRSNIGEPESFDDVKNIVIPGAMMYDYLYTLQGVKVEKPTAPGVYIRNGKKIVIK